MKRKDDSATQRHGGMVLRVAVVAVLVAAVVFFLRGGLGGGGAAEGPARYAIVFDAGSTGSRIHVFKFHEVDGALDLQSDTFEQLKPGLSSFADDPPAGAQSLEPLMKVARETVPQELQAETPVMVGATAGLRLLPEGKADVILAEVTKYLQASPFKLVDNGVRVIDGTEEGAFAWLTLNYLLGKLGAPAASTVAAIDLGGGSVQQAFALEQEHATKAPKDGYIMPLKGGGREYSVYVHSYLGYGLMAGRAAVLQVNGTQEGHPCVPKDHRSEYEYAGAKHPMVGHPEGAAFDRCSSSAMTALRYDKDCGAPVDECSFDGVWSGAATIKPAVLYVSSYFWDRATETMIVQQEDAVTAEVTVEAFGSAAHEACSTALPDVVTKFPKVQELQAPFLCLDLSYMHSLLTKGFRVPEERIITIVKRIIYKGNEVEAAWPLGAAINIMG